MALVSPGVEVTVTNESAYVTSDPGTVPLILVASAQDKHKVLVQAQRQEQPRQMQTKFI